jgi:hypothetical protein
MHGPEPVQRPCQDGVVVLQGRWERRGPIPMVVRAVAAVEGVVRVATGGE